MSGEAWPREPFGSLLDGGMCNGLSPSTGGTVPGKVLTLSSITQGPYDPAFVKDAFFDRHPATSQFARKGTFLICRGNGNLNLVGVGRFATGNAEDIVFPDTIIGGHIDESRVAARYLEAVWSTRETRRQIEAASRTTNGTHKINQAAISGVMIPLPPIGVQCRIAAILDRADAVWRKRQESIRLANEFLRSAFLEMFGDPITNPRVWPVTTLGEQAAELRYGTSVKCGGTAGPGSQPVLRIPNIIGGGTSWDDLKYAALPEREVQALQLRAGDILFVRSNGNPDFIGRCAVFSGERQALYASYLIRARLKAGAKVRPDFVRHVLSAPTYRWSLVREARTTAGNYNISTEGLRRLRLIAPPLPAQDEFLRLCRAAQKAEQRIQQALQDSLVLFETLVHRAFRGEL